MAKAPARPVPGTEGSVCCPLCRRQFRAITNRHLQDKHGLTVAEFRQEWPRTVLWSTRSKRKLEGNTHAQGHRHTARFKARFRAAVAKPRPKDVVARIRATWKAKMAAPAFATEHLQHLARAGRKASETRKRDKKAVSSSI